MQVVKNKPKEELSKRKREQRLKGLLYKKTILENQLKVSRIGADVSCAYLKAIDERMKQVPENSYEWLKLRYERMSVERKASDHIADFKEFQKNYEDGLIMEIQQVTEREQFNEIGFHYIKEQAEELAKYELYGKVSVRPPNVELVEVNKQIEDYIECLQNLITETQSVLENDKSLSAYNRAKMETELFEYSLHLQAQQRRLNKRLEYYHEQFMPVYKKDMEECEKNLDRYMEIARKVVELNIDPTMNMMMDEHEKHKDEPEQLWLFYTALRTRLKSIAKHFSRHKKKNPKAVEILSELM